MTPTDLYLSMLEKANVKTCFHNEITPSPDFDFKIQTDEFTISNKQGLFMNKLLSKRKSHPYNQQLCISATGTETIYLIFPPHYIKKNGFFLIIKETITHISKLD
jgi:hypothetical protein